MMNERSSRLRLNRRRFLHSAGMSLGCSLLPGVMAAAGDSSADQDLLAEAKARIEKHRKGQGTIVLRDASGRRVAGAKIRLEQKRHQFLFGCNLFRLGRIANPDREQQYRDRFAALLNYATLGFYWPYYEPERGHPIYDYTDQVAQWAKTQGVTCKGHPLVWDFADPKWLPRDFSEIAELSHARVREIVSRYRGQIDIWDVVNEPTHLGRFHTRLGEWAIDRGAVPYVAEHLKIARAANPAAKLLVNDYRTDADFYKILDQLRDGGKPSFDAVGIQSHMHGGGWPLERLWQSCDRFAALGRPLHFTETTIVSGPRRDDKNWAPTTAAGEAAQAEYVPKFYTMVFAHPAVEALTWWDFSDDGAWQGAAAGWLRNDMSPKPVYDRLHDLIKRDWWTIAHGETGPSGEFKAQAFYGNYELEIQTATGMKIQKKISWKRGEPNRFEIQI